MPNFKNLFAATTITALTVFGVSSASAAIIEIDPGTPGTSISELVVTVAPTDLPAECISVNQNCALHVVFSDMKHVQFFQTTAVDILVPPAGTLPFAGQFWLTDMNHTELDNTRRIFSGIFNGQAIPLLPPFDPVIFHDFHFEFEANPFLSLPLNEFDITLNVGRAGVGIWAPISEPGALAIFGLGLLGLGLIRRQKRAA